MSNPVTEHCNSTLSKRWNSSFNDAVIRLCYPPLQLKILRTLEITWNLYPLSITTQEAVFFDSREPTKYFRKLSKRKAISLNYIIPSLYNITFSRTRTFPRDHWHLWCWRSPVGISGQPSGWPWLCHIGSSLLWLWRSSQEIRHHTPGLLWRSPVLHASTHPGSPNVLYHSLQNYLQRGCHFALTCAKCIDAAVFFFQRFLLLHFLCQMDLYCRIHCKIHVIFYFRELCSNTKNFFASGVSKFLALHAF